MTASTATAGYQGVFKISTVALVQIQTCEITINGKTYDVTVMNGSSTPVWSAFLSGIRDYTLKVSGFWDQANDAVQGTFWTNLMSGAPMAWSFSPNAGTNSYSGNAIFTNIPLKFPYNGPETAEWNLQGSGSVSYT